MSIFRRSIRSIKGQKARGYGMALLAVFIASSIAIGLSLQMMSGPMTAAYLGSASQDNMAARKLAQAGLQVVASNLQTLYNTGTVYDNTTKGTYTYSSASAPASVQMPQSPSAINGAQATVGAYTGSIAWVNGNNLLVRVVATVGSSNYTATRFITLAPGNFPLDKSTGATAAYGLRRLKADNTSISTDDRAIRVRRSSDNTEMDIGFLANGDLDIQTLTNFLDGTATPQKILDRVGSASAAYGLRKLRTAYTGSAIRVRRSTDDAELDIGFLPNGDLDTTALTTFVGSASGFVTTWYDQSTNARHQTQATTTVQPFIVNGGLLVTVNGRPAIRFDGVNDFIAPTTFNVANNFTIVTLARPTATQDLDAKNGAVADGTSGQRYLIGPDSGAADPRAGFSLGTNGVAIYNGSFSGLYAVTSAPLAIGSNPVISTMVYISKRPYLYVNSQLSDVNYPAAFTNVYAGTKIGGREYEQYYAGDVSEVIVYPSSLSTGNRQAVENSMAMHHFLPLTDLGYVPPLSSVGSPHLAYGLRKLRADYNSVAIKVRRSGDNALLDIGFDGKGNLDVASLMNFCGSNSCYVNWWHDQSGNSRHAVQDTVASQPRIVNAGVLETLNGRPAIYFAGGDDYFISPDTLLLTGDSATAVAVGSLDTTDDYPAFPRMVSSRSNSPSVGGDVNSTVAAQFLARKNLLNTLWGYRASAERSIVALPLATGFQASSRYNGVDHVIRMNGVASAAVASTGNFNINNILIGTDPTFAFQSGWKGPITEVLFYPSALTDTSLDILDANQMAYYNINAGGPPDTGFITTWYDQSGNNYHFTQSKPQLQPTIRIDRKTNRPTIVLNGRSTYMTSPNTLSVTSNRATAFVVGNLFANTAGMSRLFSGKRNADTYDSQSSTSAIFVATNITPNLLGWRNGARGVATNSLNQPFQTTSFFDGTNHTMRVNSIAGTSVATTSNFDINQLFIGVRGTISSSASPDGMSSAVTAWNGSVSEIILYPSNPTTAQMLQLERDQRSYHGTP